MMEMRDHLAQEEGGTQEPTTSQKRVKKGHRAFVRICMLSASALIGGLIGAWVVLTFGPKPTVVTTVPEVQEEAVSVPARARGSVVNVVKKVRPAVVSIVATQEAIDLFGRRYETNNSGTGFILTTDGLILTNKHIVAQPKAGYTVVLDNGKRFEAKEILPDPFSDLAFVRIAASGLPVVELGDSSAIQAGQDVVAIGNALGAFQNTITSGIISALDRSLDAGPQSEQLQGVIQTDATINPGNSGGPLLDLDGRVIGVNTAIVEGGEQIGFAIPIDDAKSAFNSVLKNGRVIRPVLGIRSIQITPELAQYAELPSDHGLLLASGRARGEEAVVRGSPAEKAGLKDGDILLSIAGQALDERHSVTRVLSRSAPGETVEIEVLRKSGKRETLSLVLGESGA